jgi:endonuclease YncB( thermonuclease family)
VISLAIALYMTAPYAIDGDTISIGNERVRLVQIDTPELGSCYGQEARLYTQVFLQSKGSIKLIRDTKISNEDKYGRSLRYVVKGNRNLNLELVRGGYAKPFFFNKIKGKYAQQIEQYAKNAKAKRLGVWSCRTGDN